MQVCSKQSYGTASASSQRGKSMTRVRGVLTMLALSALLHSTRVRAQEAADSPPFVEIHGFVSQGFLVSSQNDYLAATKKGSFEMSEVGINFTKELTPDLRIGLQLFARDLGPLGNYA